MIVAKKLKKKDTATESLRTHERERAAVPPRDGREVGGSVLPHEVDVLVGGEAIELVAEEVVVVHVEDGVGEAPGEPEELGRVGGEPGRHDHVRRPRVPPHGVVAVPVVLRQAGQGRARRQRRVEQRHRQETGTLRVPAHRQRRWQNRFMRGVSYIN